ncbi:uncharacterized protein OCT59_024027 [Rhizophagus irregularis]|uniref:uncharacterized protein n=1 Tax=Rhizophagus irregularis TaxID=588596 RepID=UPI003319DB0A|nr:hypothetical protein OCT59_024027 [Rhizophagus irregularis]
MGDITKLARNEVDDLNYHFLQYCKCSVTTAKKLKSVASMDITLPTVRLSVKGEMGMEDTINDDGPYCVKEAENEFRTSISKVKEAETSSGPISKVKETETSSRLPQTGRLAIFSLHKNDKDYLANFACTACTIAHIEVKEAERQVPDSHIEGFHIEGTRNRKAGSGLLFRRSTAFRTLRGLHFEGPRRRRFPAFQFRLDRIFNMIFGFLGASWTEFRRFSAFGHRLDGISNVYGFLVLGLNFKGLRVSECSLDEISKFQTFDSGKSKCSNILYSSECAQRTLDFFYFICCLLESNQLEQCPKPLTTYEFDVKKTTEL